MIKNALEYLIGLGKSNLHEIGGEQFSDKELHKIKVPTVDVIEVSSLSGFVDYIKSDFDRREASNRLMVHVKSPTSVFAFDEVNCNARRNYYIKAAALLPGLMFGFWYDTEMFNVALQSCFMGNEDRSTMLKIVGNIKEEAVQTVADDGISQAVTAKAGVATLATVKVPNPVKLVPYRTFVEVEQPESDFIFRMKNGPQCALFEADGGAWKLEAMDNIKDYLMVELEEEIAAGKVVLIA